MEEVKIQESLNDILEAINIIKDNAATKDDIKAIRDDLKSYATKDDLKESLKNYATKTDLKEMELSICDKISNIIGLSRGENIELMRKEDAKTLEIVEILAEKKLIDDSDKKRVISMQPFAKSI